MIVYQFRFGWTNPVWTLQGRAKDVLKGIAYQFLFDWHNTCWNTPWTGKRCPQNDRLPVPIWLTQNQFEHPEDMQKISSKGSSTSSYLIDTTPVWTPHGRAKVALKMIVYQFLFEWHNTCFNTPCTCKRCPQNDRLPVPIWLTKHMFGHPMDVQKMSSKGSSTSSYLNVPTLFEHPMDVQKMSSKGSSTNSYLTNTKPVWTPHGRPKDVLKVILYKFLFECPNPIWTPHERAKDVLKMIVYLFLFD